MLFKQITLDPAVFFHGGDYVEIFGEAETQDGDCLPFWLCFNENEPGFYVDLTRNMLAPAGLGLAVETATATVEKMIADEARSYYGPEISEEYKASWFE